MNDRIKTLMDQTLDEKFSGTWSTMDLLDLQKFAERFAEKIVWECADLFVNQKYMILNPHEPFANERVRALKEHDKDTVRKIKQHFGVEE